VKYYDTDNTLTTLSSTVYDVLGPSEAPAFLQPAEGESWPTTYQRPDSVVIRFDAGFGAASAVPDVLKEAVLMKTEQLFDPGRFPDPSKVDKAARDMLSAYDWGAYA